MVHRLHKTLIDYLVIAISPALIIALVGSLVFFLLEVFYQGNFHGRLQYIFALFVVGAVLIGRISIEEGRERAALFALPLGIVTLLAINKFVEFHGGALASLSFFINCGLIGLIWWSADKLTWDCTLIDESEEDSGEGLLEAVGLERPDRTALQEEIAPAPEATTARDEQPPGWWERFVERRRRPHAPGVWVVYFSLAAVALFGIGQLFLPADDPRARRYAFGLLFIYTASGLGLLLTTSFLGLRRYLRQRRQEMPLMMVNLWLGIGAVMIACVMFSALFLPRPNPEYAASQLPFHVGSPDQKSSRYGKSSDGVEEKQPWARGRPSDNEQAESVVSEQQGDAESESGKEVDKSSSGDDESNDKSQSTASQDSERKATRRSDAAEKTPPENAQAQREDGQGSSDAEPLRAFAPLKFPLDVSALLADFFKWFLYGVLGLLAIFWIWSNRDALLRALVNFGPWLLNFWHNLFGRASRHVEKDADEAAPARVARRRFADFTDPFAAGTADRYAPEELVRYTFEALEAWASDHDYPRQAEQTPHEFTRCLVSNVSWLADDARRLADLYCQAAYASGTLPAANIARLSRLWRNLARQ